MRESWNATIDFSLSRTGNSDIASKLLDAFASYGAAVAMGEHDAQIIISLSATNHTDSFTEVNRLLPTIETHTGPFTLTKLELLSPEALAKEDEEHDKRFCGLSEVAEILGVSKQRANRIVLNQSFPAPLFEISSGRVWRTDSVTDWMKNWERKAGRPSK